MAEVEDRMLRAMRRLIHATDSHSKRMERSAGITIPQLLALRALQEGGTLSVNQLAAAVSLSPPTLVPILDKLEQRALIQRRRGTVDRRNVFVELTEAGKAAVRAAPAPLDRSFVERFATLPAERQETLVKALEEIVALMAPLVAVERSTLSTPAPDPAGAGA